MNNSKFETASMSGKNEENKFSALEKEREKANNEYEIRSEFRNDFRKKYGNLYEKFFGHKTTPDEIMMDDAIKMDAEIEGLVKNGKTYKEAVDIVNEGNFKTKVDKNEIVNDEFLRIQALRVACTLEVRESRKRTEKIEYKFYDDYAVPPKPTKIYTSVIQAHWLAESIEEHLSPGYDRNLEEAAFESERQSEDQTLVPFAGASYRLGEVSVKGTVFKEFDKSGNIAKFRSIMKPIVVDAVQRKMEENDYEGVAEMIIWLAGFIDENDDKNKNIFEKMRENVELKRLAKEKATKYEEAAISEKKRRTDENLEHSHDYSNDYMEIAKRLIQWTN